MTLTNDDLRRWATACRSGLFPLSRSEHLAEWRDGTMHLHPVAVLAVVQDPSRFPDWPVGWDKRLESELEQALEATTTKEDVDLLSECDHFWRVSETDPSPYELAEWIETRIEDSSSVVPFVLAILLGMGAFLLAWAATPA